MSAEAPEWRVVELEDERTPKVEDALELIADAFPPPHRQPLEQLRMELAEKRLRLLTMTDFLLLVASDAEGRVGGTASGVYLSGINAGLITYLVVRRDARGGGVGARLREALLEGFRADAHTAGYEDLAYVLGEVETDSPWLSKLVRDAGVIPFEFDYYHPGMAPDSAARYTLYRQPVGDARDPLPFDVVRQILYAIYRRGYRVRYPLGRPGFTAMLDVLSEQEAKASR